MRGPWVLVWTLVAGSLVACLVACDDAETGGEGERAIGAETDEAPSARSAWVSVRRPTDATLVELPARVVAAASSRSRLDATFRSTVVGARVQVGDVVEAGDPIVELRVPALLEAAAVLSGTGAQIGSHQVRRARLEGLREQGLVGAGDIFDVETGIGKLSAKRRLALATLQAAGVDPGSRRELLRRGTIELRAPIGGVVADLDVVPGEVLEAGDNLAQILGVGPARIEVAHSGATPTAVALEFVGLDGSRFALDPEPVATAIEPGLGRTLAWYEPADGRALPDGLRGRVRIEGEGDTLLEVPRRALRLDGGKAFVARRGAGAQPEAVEVEVLRSAGSSALVRSEVLRVDDLVAADAATVLTIGRNPGALGGEE